VTFTPQAPPAARVPAATPARSRMAPNGPRAAVALGLVVLAVLVALPLLAVVAQAVLPHLFGRHPSIAFDASALRRVLTTHFYFHMLADSALLGAGAAVAATAVGGTLAVLAGRTDLPGRGLWTALTWGNLLMPSFLVAEGWMFFLQPEGLLSRVVHEPAWLQNAFSSPWGVGAIFVLKFYPFAFLTVGTALPWIGGEQEAVARTLGAGRLAVWRRVYLPLLLPFLLSAAAIVFAEVLSDFGVAITVAESQHFPLLTYGIYSALYELPTDFGGAGAMSLLLTLAVAAALAAQTLLLRGRRYATIHAGFRPAEPIRLGRARLPMLLGVMLFFAVALGFPAVSVVAESFFKQAAGYTVGGGGLTLAHYVALAGTAGREAWGAFLYSLRLAAATATATVLFGTLLAYLATESGGRVEHLLQGLSLWTISVPGIILASGYVFFWNQPWLAHAHVDLYGTLWALGLSYVAWGVPYVLRVQSAAMGQLDRRLVAAGRVLGAGGARLFVRIVAPLLGEGWVSLWLFLLVGTVFELANSQFLYPPGHPPLAVEINRLFDLSHFGQATALSVAAGAVLIAVALAVRALLRGGLGPRNSAGRV